MAKKVFGLQHFHPLELLPNGFFHSSGDMRNHQNLVNQLGKPSNEILLHLKMYNKTTLLVHVRYEICKHPTWTFLFLNGMKENRWISLLEQGK